MRRIYPVKMPSIVQRYFSDYTWRFSSKEKTLYLTFDDGPIPGITDWVLDELKKYDAKGTFFCIGDNVKKHPQTYTRILQEGHQVGNHTYNHLNGWKTPSETYLDNTVKGKEYIKSNLFRPPYGKIKKQQAKQLLEHGYQIIMWEVLSADFDEAVSKEKCLKNVISKSTNGSIIVFHDSIKTEEKMKYALTRTLDYFSKKGFQFKAI